MHRSRIMQGMAEMTLDQVRYGMIGGGKGAFIGGVHRIAARIAGNWNLVAGALSSTPNKARASGAEIGLPTERSYGSWQEMLEREASLLCRSMNDRTLIALPAQ